MTTDNKNIRDINELIKEENSTGYSNMNDDEIKSLIAFHGKTQYNRGYNDGVLACHDERTKQRRDEDQQAYDRIKEKLESLLNASNGGS